MNTPEKIPVDVILATHQEQDNEVEDYHVKAKGYIVTVGENTYLRYQEENKENHKIPVIFKFQSDGQVILTRGADDLRLQLHFNRDQQMLESYRTPYGPINLLVKTTKVKIALEKQPYHGDIMIDYNLVSDEQLLGKYEIRLIFTE